MVIVQQAAAEQRKAWIAGAVAAHGEGGVAGRNCGPLLGVVVLR